MKNFVLREKLTALLTVLMAVCLSVCALMFAVRYAPLAADEKVAVTSAASGKVSLGELCERHDLIYAVLPGGTAYLSKDKSLQKLYSENRLTVYNFDDEFVTSNNELLGYKNSGKTLSHAKTLLVVPNTVTAISASTETNGSVAATDMFRSNPASIFGIAFEDGSKIASVPDNLFNNFTNLYFCILPSSVTSIGENAFQGCTVLQDIVMPNVTSIGKNAFNGAINMYHISLPATLTSINDGAFTDTLALCDIENNSDSISATTSIFPYAMNIYGSSAKNAAGGKSYLRVYDYYETTPSGVDGLEREFNKSLVFCYNNLREGILASTSAGNVNYSKKWYFITLAGAEDKDVDKINWQLSTTYEFPKEIDLTAAHSKITYDWLGSDGTKYINNFTVSTDGAIDKTITQYDINFAACHSKRFPRIIFPEGTVTTVGDYAFLGSQINLVDIAESITTIGKSAFRVCHRPQANVNNTIYIRATDPTKLNIGQFAFSVVSAWGTVPKDPTAGSVDRKFIFANNTAYDKESYTDKQKKYNSAGDSGLKYTYLVPLNTVVTDGASTKKTYTEEDRLYNENFTLTKDANGKWTEKTSGVKLPALEGYTYNIWYADNTFRTAYNDDKSIDNAKLKSALSASSVSELNLYTKYITPPEFEEKTFTFNNEVSATKSLKFEAALGFTEANKEDYAVPDSVKYTNFNNVVSDTSVVQNAGIYTVPIVLNPKWGSWDNLSVYTAEITVNRAELDLGDLNNIPEFVTLAGAPLGGTGEGTTLNFYPDGWYLYAKTDSNPSATKTVLNSYARYTQAPITISATDKMNAYYTVNTNSNATQTDSGEYLAQFTFEMTDHNYVFVNTSYEKNKSTFEKLGISYTNFTAGSTNVTSATVTKYWYIVMQQNWLIDSEASAGDKEQFKLITKDGQAASSLEYGSVFGKDNGEYQLHKPQLAMGKTDDIKFTVTYDNVAITAEALPVDKLSEYINSAMPAGTYTIRITAASVNDGETTLPAINDVIIITVTPKKLGYEDIVNLLGKGSKNFEHSYEQNTVFLFGDNISDNLNDEYIPALDGTLNTARTEDSAGIWKDPAYDKYYGISQISYNLDRMRDSKYYTADELKSLDKNNVPCNVGEYVIYYCISAPNYQTVGGQNAADRRDYKFNTLIYREVSTTQFAVGGNNTIKNLTYNGSAQYPEVPYDRYYTHSFPDADYVNADKGGSRHTVLFTLNDTVLSRWTAQDKPDNVTINSDGTVTVKFEINPATNSWVTKPQMPSWIFNGFNADVNTVVAALRFGEAERGETLPENKKATITYSLVTQNGVKVGIKNNTVVYGEEGMTSFNFKVDADGKITDETAIKVLNALKPGAYYLESAVTATGDGNVSGFVTAGGDRHMITVFKDTNVWTSTPNVMRWAWGGYDQTKNTITAIAKYPALTVDYVGAYAEELPRVIFSIKKKGGAVIEGLENFTAVDDDIVTILETLDEGAYVLVTSLAGTDYYSAIATTEHEFNISQAVNTWTTTPNVIRWTWGEYDSAKNLITAVAKYNSVAGTETAPEVQFTILNGSYQKIDGLVNFTAGNGIVTEEVAPLLKGLDAGTYYLVAAMAGRHNYTAINGGALGYDFADAAKNRTLQPVEFRIAVAINSWTTTPKMTAWQYKQFDAATNFVAGVSKYPEADKTVQYGIYTAQPAENAAPEGEHTFTAIDTVKDFLTALNKGTYWLVAYVAGADNKYLPLYSSVSFEVTQATANDWKTPPAITGWVYGKYTESVLTAGEANLGTVRYSIYKADQNGNKGGLVVGYDSLGFDDLKPITKLGALDAGNYILCAFTEVGAGENFVAAVLDIRFTVEKADNGWVVGKVPDIAGWIYGNAPSTLTEGTALHPNGDVQYKYYKAVKVNGVWVTDGESFDVSETTLVPVGDYLLIATVEESENYKKLEHSVYFRIEKAGNDWAENYKPEDALEWVWGEADEGYIQTKKLYTAKAQKQAEGVTPVYKIVNTADGSVVADSVAYADIIKTLVGLGAGQYTVTTTIAGTDDYSGVTANTVITIGKATFTWTEPADTGWVWDGTSNDKKTLTDPQAKDKDGNPVDVEFTVVKGGASTTHKDFNAFQNAMFGADVGEYTVTATLSDPNYNTKTNTFKVTVTKAPCAWTTEPQLTIEREYGKTLDSVTAGVHKFGPAVYTYTADGTTVAIPDLLTWVNTERDVGKYTILLKVTGNDNYEGEEKAITVTIKGISAVWANAGELKDEYTFTYADDITGEWDKIKIPLAPDGVYSDAEAKFTFSVNNSNAINATGIVGYLKENCKKAGVYTITATCVPSNKNYSSLTYEITVTVNKIAVEWTNGSEIKGEYIEEYGKITMPTPTTNVARTVTYTVTDLNGKKYDVPSDGKLKEFLNTLPVGEYSVKYKVEADDNYTGLEEEEVRLVINKAANSWKKPGVLVSEVTFDRLNEIKIDIPEPLSGELKFKIGNETFTYNQTNVNINKILNDRDLLAGDYNLEFFVDEDDNHYGIQPHKFVLHIVKAENDWAEGKEPEAAYSWSGNVKADEFKIPQALNKNEVLRFDIVKAGGNYNAQRGLDVEAFKKELGKLTNGTYTVTMRLGSTGPGETDEAVVAYDKDYELVIGTTEITVTPSGNSWKTELEVPSWTYGDGAGITVTRPEAAFGNNTIKFAVIGEQFDGKVVGDSFTDNDFDVFVEYIKGLNAGTYSAIASVDASDTYGATPVTTVRFTISKVKTAWSNTAEELESKRNLSWTWSVAATSANELPNLVVSNWKGTGENSTYTIKYTLTDLSTLTSRDLLSTENWGSAVRAEKPGKSYRLTASVAVDNNHEPLSFETTIVYNKFTVAWSNEAYLKEVLTYEYGTATDVLHTPALNENLIPGYSDTREVLSSVQGFGETSPTTFTGPWSDKLGELGVGTYIFKASVEEDDYRTALTYSTTVTVERADNAWFSDANKTYSMGINSSYVWDSETDAIGFVSPVPAHNGDTIVTVTVKNGSEIIFVVTLHYEVDSSDNRLTVNNNDVDNLNKKLRALDVGAYTVTAEIPESDFYNKWTQEPVTFSVTKATNGWKENGAPHYSTEGGRVTFYSDPIYGNANDVKYYFAKTDGYGSAQEVPADMWQSAQFTERGNYYFKAELAGTDNYAAMEPYYGNLSIEMELNNWAVMPGINGWQWNGFDRTVNIFRGAAINNGDITFKIQAHIVHDGIEGDRALKQADFTVEFTDTEISLLGNFRYENKDSVYVSEEIERLLKALKPGQYKLTVSAEGDGTYQGFASDVIFEVSRAENSWRTPANVQSFTYGSGEAGFTEGETVYGESGGIRYKLFDSDNQPIVIDNTPHEGGYTAAAIRKALKTLHVGNYTLTAWAAEGEAYKAFRSETDPYSVAFKVIAVEDKWLTGKEPISSIEILFLDLQKTENISELFAEPEAVSGGVAVYQILNTDYTTVTADYCGYDELLGALKELNAGEYNIKVKTDASGNYHELISYINLKILRKDNDVVIVKPDEEGNLVETTVINGQWNADNTVLDDFEIQTTDENDKVIFKIDNGEEITGTVEALRDAVKALNAGEHVVTIKTIRTNEYEEVTDMFSLNIAPAENKLVKKDGDAEEEWDIKTSFVFADASGARKDSSANSWSWGTAVTWLNPRAKFGGTVIVTISREDGAADSLTYTINAEINELAKIEKALSAFDVGTYIFKVSAPAPDGAVKNWTASEQSTTFEITKAGNGWKKAPVLIFRNESVTEWTYGSEATPTAEAVHGAVRFEYFVKGSSKALAGQPVNAGEYVVKFIVDETANYDGYEEAIEFKINKDLHREFVVSHGTTGWIWGEYRREVNLFNGIPETQGAVSFTILADGEVVSVNGERLTGIRLVSEAGVHTGKFDVDVLVPEEAAALIAKLTAGAYTLRIDVGATENYREFSAESPFVVTAARNEWITTPRVAPWFSDNWNADENTPYAVSKFGNPDIVIRSKVNDEIYYEAVYDADSGKYVITNNLAKAPVGWYTMEASVEPLTGMYNNLLTDKYDFQVFLQGTSVVKNDWNIKPGIANWTATSKLDEISMPEGKPLRGKPYFVFYKREGDTQGKEIISTDKVFRISAGEAYAKDFFIPEEPGTYYMRAYVESYDQNGNIIVSDSEISSELIPFEIKLRDNSWVIEPRMETKLYLGEKDKWAEPVATAFEPGSEYTRTYVNTETGKTFVEVMPDEPGRYKLIMTATAKYCKPLDNSEANFTFTVELSPNSWITAPNILSWTEEVEPETPTAEAMHFTENIVFTYVNVKKPDEILTERPTREGSYIMYAELKADGYETLTYECKFTIGSAFDTDLLIVDIVLGVIAIGLGAAVVCLAIRRYKEC